MNWLKFFKKKNEVWKYKYQSYEIMITMKRERAKASKVSLYINGEKVNESLLRLNAGLEGTLPNGEIVFTRLHSGIDNVECYVIVGKKPPLEKHGKDISDDEVATFAAMGMLTSEFHQLPDHRHRKSIAPGRKE